MLGWWLLVAWSSYLLLWVVLYLCFHPGESAGSRWKQRLQWLFGSKGSEALFEEIAWMFESYARGLNLVPSDIMAGLRLLQMQDENDDRPPVLGQGPTRVDAVLQELDYFAKYYLAVYGSVLYVYMHPCKWVGDLCCGGSCFSRPQYPVEGGSNPLSSRALQRVTQLEDEHLLYVSFVNDLHRPVYYIALDTEKRCIILAIRGSLSLVDTLTDLNAEPITHTVEGYRDVQVPIPRHVPYNVPHA